MMWMVYIKCLFLKKIKQIYLWYFFDILLFENDLTKNAHSVFNMP